MTLEELFTLLNTISGFMGKVVYLAWPEGEAPQLPYICYYEEDSDNFAADNKVGFKSNRVIVEFYSKKKDETSEALIESTFDSVDLFYQSEGTYVEDEKCYLKTYFITL